MQSRRGIRSINEQLHLRRVTCIKVASKIGRDFQRSVCAALAHFAFKRIQALHFAYHTKRLRVHEPIDQLAALDGAIFVQNNQRHMFHVVIERIAERNHLDQWWEKKEEQRQRIARDDDEFLEQNCAESAEQLVFHVLYKERRSLVRRRGDLEIALPWISFTSLRMTSIRLRRLLLFSGVLGRKLDKYVFERRAYFVNLGMTDADFAQLLVNLRALDTFIDQQMHRLAEDRGAVHSAHLMHGMQCRGHMIASYVESARPRRVYLRQFF